MDGESVDLRSPVVTSFDLLPNGVGELKRVLTQTDVSSSENIENVSLMANAMMNFNSAQLVANQGVFSQ